MGPPQPARGGAINIGACARPIAVDNRISIPYYFRIADSLLQQADVYRNEKNILDLYIILLRYSSLLCETIPEHRDFRAFKLREKALYDKLKDVIIEFESLKPVVERQVAEHNRGGGTVESDTNSLNGTYATTRRIGPGKETGSSRTEASIGVFCGVFCFGVPRRRHDRCLSSPRWPEPGGMPRRPR